MSRDRPDRHVSAAAAEREPGLGALLGAFAALMLLLALTVGASFIDLGPASVVVAMLVSVAKTLVIMLVFMHLAWRNTVTRLFASAAFLWLALLIGLSLTDFLTR
ncbi:MAG: cytochrome C oxidase subunit IV family protein [Deltaproteobacteria bacterium]|nr:cytochrome C oxidase subunit IV family protein [Deltaproteobacteria bacterium]